MMIWIFIIGAALCSLALTIHETYREIQKMGRSHRSLKETPATEVRKDND